MKKTKDNLKSFLEVKNSTDTTAELYFYGDIVSDWWGAWADEDQYPDAVKGFLAEHKDKDLNIYMNSGGGSVFAGLAIYNMLKRHNGKKTVYIDGLAASIASVIALAGDKVIMPKSSMLMIHKPWSWTSGNANDFRKLADDMDEIEKCILAVYEENIKEGVDIQEIKNMMDAETWLTGEDAEKYFNIDTGEEKQVAACMSEYFDKYAHTPQTIVKQQLERSKSNEKELENLLIEIDLV